MASNDFFSPTCVEFPSSPKPKKSILKKTLTSTSPKDSHTAIETLSVQTMKEKPNKGQQGWNEGNQFQAPEPI